MRLPNGFGSVYKLSGTRRRPWIARKTVGWDEYGKQLYHTVGYYPSRTEALHALMEYSNNPPADDHDITLVELYERWSASKYKKLAKSTVSMYKSTWSHFERIQDLPVKDIKKAHLQDLVDAMAAKKMSYSACHKARVLASLLMKEAMSNDIIHKNYGELVELPQASTKRKQPFTDAEIETIATAAKTDCWANTILILIYTGMRIGELLGLTVFNVDIDKMTITGGIKTEAGKDRTIPVHPKIQPYVRQWHEQRKDRLVHRNGRPVSADYYRKYLYYPVLEKLELRRRSPHATRHTFATLLNRAKADTKAQQLLLGHADYATTANIYTHADLDQLRSAIESI